MKNAISRITSAISMPLAAFLVLLFFLPWVQLSCGTQELFHANGFQIATGSPETTKTFEDEQKKKGDSDEGFKARPVFWLGLVAPIVAGIVGLLGFTGALSARAVGVALIIAAGVGLVVVFLATDVGYKDDLVAILNKDKSDKPEPTSAADSPTLRFTPNEESFPGMSFGASEDDEDSPEISFGPSDDDMSMMVMSNIGEKTLAPVWLSLAMYALLLLIGIATLISPMLSRAPAPLGGPPSEGV